MNRPFSVTLLGLLAAIAGVAAVLDVLRLLGILPIAQVGEMAFFGSSILGAIFAGIVAVIWFWAALRIWNLDPQGWMFVVVIAIVYLIFDVIALIAGTPWPAISWSVILSALALILGLLPATRAAFGQR